MARQIIKQPNGKYCIFSNRVYSVTLYDMDEQDIIKEWTEESRIQIEKDVKRIISDLDEGKRPYHQFTKTYDEMIDFIKEVHGKTRSQEIKSLIDATNEQSTH